MGDTSREGGKSIPKLKILNYDESVLPVYRPYLLDYQHRYTVHYGGAGSGKSHFVLQKILRKGIGDRRKILILRKNAAHIERSVWSLMMELIGQFSSKGVKIASKTNKSTKTITLMNGTEIWFSGIDDPEKIKSINGITDIVVEEATELNQDDFNQLDLRLRHPTAKTQQIYLMFNPIHKLNWVYTHFFANGTPEDTIIIQTNYKDNPKLPEKYIRSLENLIKTNPLYYKVYVKGEFASLGETVYPVYTVRLISEEETKGLDFWCGMDFGYIHSKTAISWGYYDRANMRIYVTGEYGRTGMKDPDVADAIKALGLQRAHIIADSAEPNTIDTLDEIYGIYNITGANKHRYVLEGIKRISSHEIIVDERCPETIMEFENYSWKKDKKTGLYIDEPVKEFDHHMDAIRYGTQDIIASAPFGGC